MENPIINAINTRIHKNEDAETNRQDLFITTTLIPGKKLMGMLHAIEIVQEKPVSRITLANMVSEELALYLEHNPNLSQKLVERINSSHEIVFPNEHDALGLLEQKGVIELFNARDSELAKED